MAKRRKKVTKKTNNDRNLQIVILFIVSILMGVLIYKETGYIGEKLSPILGGIMGWIKYIIPIGLFITAIAYASDKKEMLGSKVFEYLVFVICICTILSTYQISEKKLNLEDGIAKVVSDSYELGVNNIGGGAIGTIISVPLINMLGVAGTVIISVGIALVTVVFVLGIPVAEIIQNAIENLHEKKEMRKEEINEYREQAYEKRKQKNEDRINEKKKRKLPNFEPIEEITEDQISINLNEKQNNGKVKKYDHSSDNLEPLEMGNKKEKVKPEQDYIENNLFKQQEETKEEKVKEVLTLEHSMASEDENYEFPPIILLKKGTEKARGSKKTLADTANKLQKTLYSFGVSAKVENVSVGPAITRYEIKPAEGVRVNKIANLADDIALNLAAESIRIEAPIPGKQAVGIEIPNKENEVVHLRDILETNKFIEAKSKLTIALGKNVAGEEVVADIAKMPHVLIAGSTGSGKSVCINTLITSIIYKAKPSEVKLVMVDPKIVELSVYNGIPHLLIPVVTDPKKAAGALAWAVQEMENRYALFADKGVRDLKGYNEKLREEGLTEKLPQIVIVIDELADLMMVASKDVEDSICRLAQKARAAGMHLVIATQRPSVDVITGIIKANIPSRIAFAVSSQIDSRTILDMAGAEKLLGKGDMLFYPIGASKPQRIQGAFVSDDEVEKIVDYIKFNGGEANYNESIIEQIENANKTDQERDAESQESADDTDEYLEEAIDTVIMAGTASTSYIQRKFKVGYARAGRIIDQMEQRGIISGYEGSKPRRVLISKEQWEEQKMQVDNFKAEHPEMFQEES